MFFLFIINLLGHFYLNFCSFFRKPDSVEQTASADEQTVSAARGCSVNIFASLRNPKKWAIFDGLRLILSSTYLLQVSLFLWLSAGVSSFFYFQVKYPRYLLYSCEVSSH